MCRSTCAGRSSAWPRPEATRSFRRRGYRSASRVSEPDRRAGGPTTASPGFSGSEEDPYGLRRVVRPPGALPQQAEVLDPRMPLGPDELSIDVERLNIDAASFRQLSRECGGDPARIGARVREIVAARGKMRNPATGSGGMLIGRGAEVGPAPPARSELQK